MTILDLNSGKPVVGILSRGEYGQKFQLALSRLSPGEVTAIRTAVDQRIEGKRIETSSWIPGRVWTGTDYQPIFDKAAQGNWDLAAQMFGLFAWEAFERHPLDWYTSRFSMGGEEDRFRVYFRPDA
jgi:hypothetical protein